MLLQHHVAAPMSLCVSAPGGYFIGCVPDGKRVKAHLLKANGHLEKPHLRLKTVSEVNSSSPLLMHTVLKTSARDAMCMQAAHHVQHEWMMATCNCV